MIDIATQFRKTVQYYFPTDLDRLQHLCKKGEESYWGYAHISILAELAGVDESDPVITLLQLPYVIFSAHYFLLDSAVDSHLEHAEDVLYLTHLLSLSHWLIFDAIQDRIDRSTRARLQLIMARRISENTDAVRREIQYRSRRASLDEDIYPMIVGRSNSTLLFYEILCLIVGNEPNQKILHLLSELVYYLQLGDDLGDWEEDVERGNITPLLQQCIQQLPSTQVNDPLAIEEQLFLRGIYEEYTASLINNFERIQLAFAELPSVRSTKARNYIEDARDKAYSLLTNMVSSKLDYLQNKLA